MGNNVSEKLLLKKAKLEELVRSRPKANCSSKNSSSIDVQRETEIEELEEEIKFLEKQA